MSNRRRGPRKPNTRTVSYSIPVQGGAIASQLQLTQQLVENSLTVQQDANAGFDAWVLLVNLPTGFRDAVAGSPVSSLVPAESQNTEQVTQLCQVVFMDAAHPILCPIGAGSEMRGVERHIIDMYEQVGNVASPADLTLPIPAPGDKIRIEYLNPSLKSGPQYTAHLLPNPNPGSLSFVNASMMGGSVVPVNSLEDFAIEDFDEDLLDDASGDISEGYEMADPASEHYQAALTYAEHYDNQTFGEDKYSSRNVTRISKLHPVFQTYIKAFIAKCNEEDIQIHGNSGYRTQAQQTALLDKYNEASDAYRTVNPQPGSTAAWHGIGMAFDFNAEYSGIMLNSDPNGNGSKASWLASGVPRIAEEFLGLLWAGNWNNYDPIHIDASSFFLGKYGLSSSWPTAATEIYVRSGGSVDENGYLVGSANQWSLDDAGIP